jgi:iron complex outermembrane receptor protein
MELKLTKYMGLLILLTLSIATLSAQENTGLIKGKVITSDGKTAGDVTVQIKGTTKGKVTDENGLFEFKKLHPGIYTLQISLLGFAAAEQTTTVEPGKTANLLFHLKANNKELQEVIVTNGRHVFTRKGSDYVAKMPFKNLENSQVYTTITKELLTDQMVFSADDAMKNAPGLQKMWEATGRSGDGGAYYNSRGFILQSQLRDGLAGNVSATIDAADLESIEIIKGPSATLFGSTLTSYGGLINRITKKPYVSFGGDITYASGSYGFNRISADINTPFDSAKNVLFRLNTAYHSEGSFQDNGFEKGYVIAPSLSYKVNDHLSFLFNAEITGGTNSSKQIIFFYFPVSQLGASRADQLGIDYKRSYSANDIYQTSSNTNFYGQMNYKMSSKWTSQTNFTSTHSFSNGPYAYFYLLPNTGRPGSDSLVRADQSTANSEIQVTEIQQNFTGDFAIGRIRNRIVAGLDFFSQNSNQLFYGSNFDTIPKNGTIPTYTKLDKDNLNAVLQDPSKVWAYPYIYKTNTYSAYLSDVINLTDRLIALAAIRVDYFDNKGNMDRTTGLYSGGYHQTAFSPKFGLVYQPVKDHVSLFANYQNGFTNETGLDYAGKSFKPEQANQTEGGVKLDLWGGKLNTTLSYYYIKVTDLVRPYAANPNFSIQDGTQVSRGFEAEIIANPLPGLHTIAGFSYNDSKLEKADPDVEGRRPATAMSPYTANLWLSYQLPQGLLQGLGLGFGGNFASDNKVVNSVYYGQFTLPAYTIFNATLFYDHPKFRAGIKMDNITNKEYWIGYSTMNPQKLRSVTASITFKF